MANWILVAGVNEIAAGHRKLCEVAGKRLAVFNHAGEFLALDNHCPHRGGPLGAGPLLGNELTCPWHGWQFNIISGACVQDGAAQLTRYAVELREHGLYVNLEAVPTAVAQHDGIFRYLVRYGTHAFVGRFGSIRLIACQRGQHVVVQTGRGLELGQVLATPESPLMQRDRRPPGGELLRLATATEIEISRQPNDRAARVLERARMLAAEKQLPVTLVDAEELLDGATLMVYYLGAPSEKLGPLAVGLGQWARGVRVQFQPLEGAALAASEGTEANLESEGERRMKGPAERLKYDLRRLWECPVCHHRERAGGELSSLLCPCQEKVEPTQRKWMKLLEDGVRRNPEPKAVAVKTVVERPPTPESANEGSPSPPPDVTPER